MTHESIFQEFQQLANSGCRGTSLMQIIANRLREAMVRCNWVAFYVVDPNDDSALTLGPYTGMETPHKRIPFDKGICGAVASTGKTIVVSNVRDDPRYLPDSDYTKSEIVVPMFAHGRVIGEIDVSSFFEAAFDDETRTFLERCATLVANSIEEK